jgi:hypothetical protein
MNLGRWTFVFFITYAVLETVFVGLAGLALNLSLRSLLLPYLMLLFCALVLAPLVHWALQSRDQPKSCAFRFALVIFVYLQLFSLAVAFNVVRLGIVSQAIILDDAAPCILVGSVITSVVVYVTARRRLEVVKDG